MIARQAANAAIEILEILETRKKPPINQTTSFHESREMGHGLDHFAI
jgi:hypothetical protein